MLRRRLSVWLVLAAAIAAEVLAIAAGETASWYLIVPLLLSTGVAMFTSPLLERRRTPLDATLDLLPGKLVVRDAAGRIRATIQARSVIGATTARLPQALSTSASAASSEDEVSLVLALKPEGSTPAVLRLADEGQADQVRRCLGIGPAGFGAAQWPIGPARYGVFRGLFRIAWRALLVAMLFVAALTSHSVLTLTMLGQAVFYVGMGALVLRLTLGKEPPWVQLSPRGVAGYVNGADGRLTEVQIPFGAIRGVAVGQSGPTDAIVLDCAPPHGKVVFETRATKNLRGIDAEERAHIVAQIQAAAERARQPSFFAEKASRLELLRRGEDTWGGWLARLDALGQTLRGAHNYRSGALDEADLWNALETPEVDVELRTAAARVLARSDETSSALPQEGRSQDDSPARARILATLSAERNPAAVKRIRVALETDTVAAVEELEEQERRRGARQR